jgi:hypothetical protein
MASLRIPLWKRGAGTLLAGIAYAAANVLFRLPDAVLARLFGFGEMAAYVIAGESAPKRALADLAFVFHQGGEGAAIFRRVLTRARWEEIQGIVRGLVKRSLL